MPAKVLVVDDEPDLKALIRQKFRKKIRQKKIQVFFACNGLEALKILQTEPDIDMVLTDINMPKMDGLTLLTKISEAYPSTKTVILSAYGDLQNIRKAMNYGAFDFLTKPIDFQDLEITTNKTLQHVQQTRDALEKERLAQQAQAELLIHLQQEVTQRQRVEEALRGTQVQLTQFLEAMPVGVFIVDAKGKTYYVNQIARNLICKDIVLEATVEQLPDIYQAYLAGTNQLYPTERQPIMRALRGYKATADDLELHQEDKIVPLEVWATPIFDDQGRMIYAIAAFQDITQRKQAEAERHTLIEELFEVNCNLELALDAESELTDAAKRFVPHEFINFLGHKSIVDVHLGDQVQREMSIMFADIRNFATLSEKMSPKENFDFINDYLSRVGPVIRAHQGFIDKYIGDAVMALFPHTADDALQAAIAMQKKVSFYNWERQQQGARTITIGIGLHTGSLMLGTIGESERMESTVIADAVNLASRLENLTKTYGSSILISGDTLMSLAEVSNYYYRFLGRMQIKGKNRLVSVFEVLDAEPTKLQELKWQTKTNFEEAIVLYHQNKINLALKIFQEVLESNHQDKAAQFYIQRCQQLLESENYDN
ncbi:MAG: response regulator [Symploca sp. SIO1A3]|nr:response regulator [Symploca sp. SIO1A3]